MTAPIAPPAAARRLRKPSRRAALPVLGLVVVLAAALTAPAVGAPSLSDKQAEAARIQAEIEANGMRISSLAEQYNQARLRLDRARDEIARVRVNLASARADTARISSQVRGRAAAMYVGAASTTPLDALDLANAAELATRATYAASTADHDAELLARLRASREDLGIAEGELAEAESRAEDEVGALESSRREVEVANARQAELLSQVKGEIAQLIRAEEARRAAAERAAAEAAAQQITGGGGTPGTDPGGLVPPDVPAPSPGAAAAVAYVKAQLGKPYRYAGVGPDAYDCSGLTMMAWAQAGVSMPHGSIAQGDMFPRVPDNEMAPGDLVIYYPDHGHVGMYVGGGMTISATHTGSFIKLQPVFRSGFQYAVRPG